MKALTFFIIYISAMLMFSGCGFHPSSYYGAGQVDTTKDKQKNIDTIVFKYSFKKFLDDSERRYLYQDIKKIESTRYNDTLQANGSDASMVAISGHNPTSGTGGAIVLGVSAIEYIIDANSSEEMDSGILISKKWLGYDGKSLTPKEATKLAKKKTITAITNIVKSMNFDIRCKYNCDANYTTFELTNLNKRTHENQYLPKKLSLSIVTSELIPIQSNEAASILYEGTYDYYADQWSIEITRPHSLEDDGTMKWEVERQKTGEIKYSAYLPGNIIITPLGRDMYKQIGKQLPTWYFGVETHLLYPFAIYQGEAYELKDTGDYRDFYGEYIVEVPFAS